MRALVQRVSQASVRVEERLCSATGKGLLVFLGICHSDTTETARTLARKTAKLRVFEDRQGRMNHSVLDVNGEVLVVSQFTLYADTTRGNRPSFVDAARPEKADPLYRDYCDEMAALGVQTGHGVFGAHMDVTLVNDGPVTVLLEYPRPENDEGGAS